MLSQRSEYEKMYKAESSLWWYKYLHKTTLNEIKAHYSNRKDIKILDIGCGTGGMLQYLQDEGYNNLSGIDFSEHALFFARQRGLKVEKDDLATIHLSQAPSSVDVIICHDVLYFIDKKMLKETLTRLSKLLHKNGIILFNFPAINAFRGMHDLVVGIDYRISKKELEKIIDYSFFSIEKNTYWPFLLSIAILIKRFFQRMLFRLNIIKIPKSDIYDLPNWLNQLFYKICLWEEKLPSFKLWGSSLFVCLKKK